MSGEGDKQSEGLERFRDVLRSFFQAIKQAQQQSNTQADAERLRKVASRMVAHAAIDTGLTDKDLLWLASGIIEEATEHIGRVAERKGQNVHK